jgi:glutamyl/glutaminyl-tRNA synthetase
MPISTEERTYELRDHKKLSVQHVSAAGYGYHLHVFFHGEAFKGRLDEGNNRSFERRYMSCRYVQSRPAGFGSSAGRKLCSDWRHGDVFWPVRVALSGEMKSPSPVELLAALGKEESLKRLEIAVSKLS